jgi:hypothetical protein
MSTKPRTLKYAETLQTVEQRIVDAMPAIVDALIEKAKYGNPKIAFYLLDRILGKTTGAKVAPADDREAPYSDAAFELDQQDQEEDNGFRRLLSGSGSKR